MAIYTYTPLDAGSNSTLANGVNDLGQIVGSSGSFGFLYSGGVYTTLNVTGATGTQAYGINNSGNIVGSYSDGNGTHGFLYSGGTYQALNDPVATATSGTNAFGINASGQIVGGYYDANGVVHGFLDSGGVYTTLNVTGATGTLANGINDLGQIVGTYSNSTGTHGFLYNISTNTYVTVGDPAGTDGNWIQGINDNGQIVGYYSDSSGFHGFVESGSTFTSLDNPLAISTIASGIAMNGEIVGSYRDSSNSDHGWLTNPPSTTVPATSVQQEIFGLYAALYGRATDFGGISYWTGIVGQQPDGSGVTTANAGTTAVTLNDAAVLGQAFVNTQSTYFNSLYGSLTDSAFINALYVNIGGNAGDPGGIAYWAGLLQQAETAGQSVQAARAGLVGQFVHDLVDYNLAAGAAGLTSAQLLAATQRQAAVDNKIAVSLALSDASQQPGGGILVVHTVGDAAYEAATTVIQGVTYDPATVTAAVLGINTAVAAQNLLLI